MDFKGMRWQVAVLSLLAVLAVLFGGYFVYHRLGLDRPLVKALKADPAVQSVRVDDGSPGREIVVGLNQVDNLQTVYERLEQTANRYLKGGSYELKVTDQRDPMLQETYDRMSFLVEEALARGNYEDMYAGLQKQAADRGLDRFRVYVGKNEVFLQLGKGADYLYAIVPRGPAATASTNLGGVGQ
ncbi:MAG: hypothetical protein ACYC41_13580 [Bacillota bacterium]